ncbi:hypothetical protein K0M31_020117 [Melipona bicolor]|uniref:Uncharacterized protein n=1 Tax=Melipona bicolor TaxID=60889 RepID=A0AA40KQH3_9HYME|nr:hypothetical protein K0M31_020117 [Melipona bicolor]
MPDRAEIRIRLDRSVVPKSDEQFDGELGSLQLSVDAASTLESRGVTDSGPRFRILCRGVPQQKQTHCQRVFSGWQNRFVPELARPDVYKFEFESVVRWLPVGRQKATYYFREEDVSVRACDARSRSPVDRTLARRERRSPRNIEYLAQRQFDAIGLLASTLIKSFN